MAKSKPKKIDISTAETQTQATLKEARGIRSNLLQQLAEGQDVSSELESIGEEIESHEKRLRNFEAARSEAAKRSTAKGRAEQHATVQAKLAEGLEEAQQLGAACRELWLLLANIGGRLSAIQDTRDRVTSSLRDAAKLAGHGAPAEHLVSSVHGQLTNAINALTLPSCVTAALWESGLGRTGIPLSDNYVQIRPIHGGTYDDPTGDLERAVQKLEKIAGTIEEWSAQAAKREVA